MCCDSINVFMCILCSYLPSSLSVCSVICRCSCCACVGSVVSSNCIACFAILFTSRSCGGFISGFRRLCLAFSMVSVSIHVASSPLLCSFRVSAFSTSFSLSPAFCMCAVHSGFVCNAIAYLLVLGCLCWLLVRFRDVFSG